MPKSWKHRKYMRGVVRGVASRGHQVAFGDWGLQSLDRGWITSQQIEAARVAVAHFLGDSGKLWIRIFPHKSVTAHPAESRMGHGKGEPATYVAVVKPGTMLFELAGVTSGMARDAFRRQAHKLPVRVRVVPRRRAL